MCKYYIVIWGAQVRYFLDVLFLLLAIVLSQPHEEPRRNNDRVAERIHSLFMTARHSFNIIFCCFLSLLSPPSQTMYFLSGPYIDILLGVVLCVMISWVNGWKHENFLQFNTSWLVFLRTWYYFRLCFSFSYSGYDLTLIKESHTLNCYSFLQKFLLKTKAYKLVVGNCGSSIYCWNNKFRKSYLLFAIYVLLNKIN